MLIISAVSLADEGTASEKEAIEYALNLQNMDQEWTYNSGSDAWTLSVVTAVTKPVIENEEGVSVCVPGAYVTGIDTDGDGTADVTAENATEAVKETLNKALPRQGESEKAMEFQHVKPKALMLI